MSDVCFADLRCLFFYKQKTAYEMRISDWSSDVCSSDLGPVVSAETTKHRFDIGSRRVAQRAGDEGAISIARGRAARGSGQRIAQPFMQVGRDPIGPVGFDRAQCIYDLADRHVAVDRAHPTPFERRREDRESTRLNSVTNAPLVCR